jgi:hypothetical protein
MKRKHISHKTARASLIVQCGLIPYDHAKLMTEDQIISLTHIDHNILHSSEHEDRDKFWNFTHRLIKEHREKTKLDAKIIAKSRRIRKKWQKHSALRGLQEGTKYGAEVMAKHENPWIRKIHSRGFDKTLTRGFRDGKVRKREIP